MKGSPTIWKNQVVSIEHGNKAITKNQRACYISFCHIKKYKRKEDGQPNPVIFKMGIKLLIYTNNGKGSKQNIPNITLSYHSPNSCSIRQSPAFLNFLYTFYKIRVWKERKWGKEPEKKKRKRRLKLWFG